MAGLGNDSAKGDIPASFYALIRAQTRRVTPANSVGLVACAIFVILSALFVLALELGADFEQLLIGAFAVAAVNLVLALTWGARARRPH